MNLYWLEAEHRYVHRQSDIPKGVAADKQEIPTDLTGLMAFLNAKEAAHQLDLQNTVVDTLAPLGEPAPATVEAMEHPLGLTAEEQELTYTKPAPDFSATAVLSRMDNPGTNVDATVETIMKAKGYALKRYAGAVAQAFHALER